MKMKRVDAMLLKVFLFGLPALAVCGIFAWLYVTGAINHDAGYAKLLNNLSGLVFAAWITMAIYLSIRLMLYEPFREQVLARITFLRERDERETLLTGKATKAIFLTSLSILIFLFCLSCIHVSIYRVPPEYAVEGKTGYLSLGLAFSVVQDTAQDRTVSPSPIPKDYLFNYQGLPISGQAIILALILWQVISYNCLMRRLMRQPKQV